MRKIKRIKMTEKQLNNLKWDLWVRGFFAGIVLMLLVWIYLNIAHNLTY